MTLEKFIKNKIKNLPKKRQQAKDIIAKMAAAVPDDVSALLRET